MLDTGDDSPDPLLGRELEHRRDGLSRALDLAESDPRDGEIATASGCIAKCPFRSAGVLVGSHGLRGVVLGLPGFGGQPGQRVGRVVQLPGAAEPADAAELVELAVAHTLPCALSAVD